MRKTLIALLIAFTVSSILGPAALAAPQKAPADAKAIEEKTVALDYKMGEIQVVFKDLARQVGAMLDADATIGGKISLTAKGVPLARVLDMICKDFHCDWKVRQGGPPTLAITSRPQATGR